jgi:transcriptional regulator with XRE-family HTH domain
MSDTKQPLTLKEQINFLFDTITHPDGRPYTLFEVAEHLNISTATINQLRTGRIKNPTLPTLKQLCQFFGVPLNFFDCQTYDACYEVVAQTRLPEAPEAAEIAFRASRLSPKSQERLLQALSWIEEAERQLESGNAVPHWPSDKDREQDT